VLAVGGSAEDTRPVGEGEDAHAAIEGGKLAPAVRKRRARKIIILKEYAVHTIKRRGFEDQHQYCN
jgi:hypothetical protein